MKLMFLNGSRGEWGYIKPIIDICIKEHIDYSICATNMLLLPSHGLLLDSILDQGYNVSDMIFMSLEGNNRTSMAKSMGIFLSSFVDVLSREKPDWLVLAGDRGEQFMGAIAAAYTYTPVAHIQAGERSGNIDGIVRHAIGKLVHLHFAANTDAADRLESLGEEKFRIHNVGAPQLDEIYSRVLPSKESIEAKLGIILDDFFLVVLHPITEDYLKSEEYLDNLVSTLKLFPQQKVWILPNNDAGSFPIINKLPSITDQNFHVFRNLDRLTYLFLLKYCRCLIGNSSSGLLEAPSFGTPAVNIGRRQKNRVQGKNVLNCSFAISDIHSTIIKALDDDLKNEIIKEQNPYGDGNSSQKIIDILRTTKVDDRLLVKNLTY